MVSRSGGVVVSWWVSGWSGGGCVVRAVDGGRSRERDRDQVLLFSFFFFLS